MNFLYYFIYTANRKGAKCVCINKSVAPCPYNLFFLAEFNKGNENERVRHLFFGIKLDTLYNFKKGNQLIAYMKQRLGHWLQ